MTDKRSRKPSLASSLQVLRNTFGGRQSQWELDKDHKNSTHWKGIRRTARMFSSGPTQNSTPSSRTSIGTYYSSQRQPQPIVRPLHQIPMSLPEKIFIMSYNRLRYDAKCLENNRSKIPARKSESRVQHIGSSSLSRASSGYSSKQTRSRIPTPATSPAGDLYTQEVYRREGRRNMLSSLEKRSAGIKGDAGTINKENMNKNRETKGLTHNKLAQNLRSQKGLSNKDATAKSTFQVATYVQKTINDNRVQRATPRPPLRRVYTQMPLTKSTSIPFVTVSKLECPRKQLASTDTRSRPSTRLFNPVPAFSSRFELGLHRENGVKITCSSTSTSESGSVNGSPLGKVRVEAHTVPKQNLPAPHRSVEDHQPEIPRVVDLTRKEIDQMAYTAKGLRWTNGFEDLKVETRAKSNALSPPNHLKGLGQSVTLLDPLPDTGSMGPRNQTGRMVLSRSHSTGTHSRLKKPGLTAHANCVSQVSEPHPQQYWLGRFVTLVNAFHYEDSFSEPDIATGFGMLSSYSRPLGHADSDEEGYRIKRAFMVLENVCLNDEASLSLRKFRNDRRILAVSWMQKLL
ncbi:hypothetical protein BDV29DRAFT_160846 [Aspergillus leporis]|uniref:Uncharacterized protein n=1 Tax=Aspergillus leporis TaxID=41062 RepID=A0A5N5WNE8_9EURO|nr:hypothetical protein BDV29DRAFT_160846 [Aspergillus leporis]